MTRINIFRAMIGMFLCAGAFHCTKPNYLHTPVVSTGDVTLLSATSVEIGGMVNPEGIVIKDHGHCWSRWNDVPDLNIREGFTSLGATLNDDNTFTSLVSPVVPETTYYVRAYVITEKDTLYGNIVEFQAKRDRKEEWLGVQYGGTAPVARQEHFSFVLNDLLYIGGGRDANGTRLKDFWAYNFDSHTWERKADLPVNAFLGMVAFAINNIGYAGLGVAPYISSSSSGSDTYNSNIYAYNPSNNTWTNKGAIHHVAAYAQVAVWNNKAYFSGGFVNSTYQNLFIEYNPVTNSIQGKANLPLAIAAHFSFMAGNKIYAGGGLLSGSLASKQFFTYDPATEKWSRLEDFPVETVGGVAYVPDGNGYVVTGRNANFRSFDPLAVYLLQQYMFNAGTGKWEKKMDFPGEGREFAAGASRKGHGYVIMGGRESVTSGQRFNNIFEYVPY